MCDFSVDVFSAFVQPDALWQRIDYDKVVVLLAARVFHMVGERKKNGCAILTVTRHACR